MNGSQGQQNIQKPAQSADLHTGTEKEKTKQCKKCKRILPHSKFVYALDNRTNKRYITSKCRECLNRYQADRKALNPEKQRKQHQERRKRNPEQFRKKKREYYLKNRDKILAYNKSQSADKKKESARRKLNWAVKVGKIVKPDKCEICSATNYEIIGHHEDYSKPLDVVWCCKSCHSLIHVGKLKEFKKRYAKFLVFKKVQWKAEAIQRKLNKQQKTKRDKKTKITIRINKDEYLFLHGIQNKWGCEMSAYVCRLIERDFSKNSKDIYRCENIVRLVSLLPEREEKQKYFALVTSKDQHEKLEKTKYVTGVRFSDYVRLLLRSRM